MEDIPGIPEDVAAVLAKLHDITNRVILPAKEKGAAHALQCARAFMDAQSRVAEAQEKSSQQ